jgi:hypothetical protein
VVDAPLPLEEAGRRLPERGVAGGAVLALVDDAEAVDVTHEHRERPA